MPATVSRIGFIQQEFRRVVSTSPAMQTRYGSIARETEDPIETYFDSSANAQVIADGRQSLLGTERRRFTVRLNSADELLALNYIGAVPVVRYVDGEKDADRKALITEITVDLEKDAATVGVWG